MLSGGSTPRGLYELWPSRLTVSQLDWKKTEFFWGDERAVPPDSPRARTSGWPKEAMLDKLGVPEHVSTASRARHKTSTARRETTKPRSNGCSVSVAGVGRRPPHFNLFLLGMGEDGHTASLFPGTDALGETNRWVVAHEVAKLSTKRITMTPPLINAAHFIMFLASGSLQGRRARRKCCKALAIPTVIRHSSSTLSPAR